MLTAKGEASNSLAYTYTTAPATSSITGISPASGADAGGQQLTITGTHFGTATGTVTVGGNQAKVVSWSDTSVVVTTPAGTAPRRAWS